MRLLARSPECIWCYDSVLPEMTFLSPETMRHCHLSGCYVGPGKDNIVSHAIRQATFSSHRYAMLCQVHHRQKQLVSCIGSVRPVFLMHGWSISEHAALRRMENEAVKIMSRCIQGYERLCLHLACLPRMKSLSSPWMMKSSW